MPPPIGPMNERQRRIELIRRNIVDINRPMREFFRQFAAINPRLVTPETFADLQSTTDDLSESIRRSVQAISDLADELFSESGQVDAENMQAARVEVMNELLSRIRTGAAMPMPPPQVQTVDGDKLS